LMMDPGPIETMSLVPSAITATNLARPFFGRTEIY